MEACLAIRVRALFALLFLAAMPSACVEAQEKAGAPSVRIDAGLLEGTHFSSDPNDVAFLGIPYAAAPTGERRWRPPQPPAAWTGTRNAKQYGPACPQLPSGWLPEMLGRVQMATEEACLFVNVWSTNLHSSKKLPVMVWIHGGGNIEGSQEWPPLGPVLAKHGVVVVALNYRLGVFGFFSHPALTVESRNHSSGNYGLLDQLAALRWVQRNIDKFGGDPKQVTVFGASSGSLNVCDLMASPLAATLFQRAILQSGVCVDGVAPVLAHAEADGQRLASQLGTQDLAKLRSIPAQDLLQKAALANDMDFNPVVDGWVFHEQPATTFQYGRQASIPVIVGSNTDEVSIFASPLVKGNSYRPKTIGEYRHWLEQTFKDHANEVFDAYPVQGDSEVPGVFLKLDTDYEFGYGSWLLAREVTRSGQKAFLYSFSYAGSGPFKALGAFHSEESILLSKRYWRSWVSSPDDEKLSNIIIGYWVQFAKTSHPDGEGLPPWPAYDVGTDRAQDLDREVKQIQTPDAARFQVFEKMLKEQLPN